MPSCIGRDSILRSLFDFISPNSQTQWCPCNVRGSALWTSIGGIKRTAGSHPPIEVHRVLPRGVTAHLVILQDIILVNFAPESGPGYQYPFGGMAPCGPLYSPQRGTGNLGLGLAESLRCSVNSDMKSNSDRKIESRLSHLIQAYFMHVALRRNLQ